MNLQWIGCVLALVLVLNYNTAWTADVGVAAKKLVLLNKASPANKAVYVSKLDAGLQKGPAGDPTMLSGMFEWFYTDMPTSVGGSFIMPSSLWTVNTDTLAKFSNSEAISCLPTCVKVVKIKPGLLAVVKTKGTSDPDTPQDNLEDGPPSNSGGITTVLTITNGNDASVHRMCTRFAVDSGSTISYKEIEPGIVVKLVAKNGVPATCP
jgi:hypothetical protein